MKGLVGAVAFAAGLAACAGTGGTVRIEAGFASNRAERIYRDVPLEGGMADADGLEFDFRCGDLSAFSSFTVYFKSGAGWYVAKMSPTCENREEHIRIAKADAVGEEDRPEGWRNVSAYRVCGWRGAGRNASFQLSNVRPYRDAAQVVVVRTESEKAEKTGAIWPQKLSMTLSAMGVCSRQLADSDLTADRLKGVKIVALPYNPSLSPQAAALLKGYVAAGGRLLVCYVLPGEIADLIGVRRTGDFVPATAEQAITGFLRKGDGLEGQPSFSPQASWRAVRTEVAGEGEVVADWADRNRRSLAVPAIVRTPAGIYLSHIWNGGTSGAPLQLMRSVVGQLAPALKEGFAEMDRKAEQRVAEQWRAAKAIGLKKGEWRAVWCHTPYGYDAEHAWEASVRLMKEMGYTDLLANLCWGGLAFYRSDVLPVSPMVETNGDALDLCLAACRRQGVRLHVWKVCWKMHSQVPAAYRAEMAAAGRTQVRFDGREDRGWFCPSHPENQRAEIEAMLELSRRGVDGVHFDYIRYNGSDGCFCDGCRRRFEAQYGVTVARWPQDVRRDGALGQKWRDFRCDNISSVVKAVAERLQGRTRTLVSAAVFPSVETCPGSVGQDWPAWCRNGWLDFVCPMDYTPSSALFKGMVRAQMRAAGKVKVYPGIGLNCWPDDGADVRRLGEQIEVVRALGLDGFTVYALSPRSAVAFPAFR